MKKIFLDVIAYLTAVTVLAACSKSNDAGSGGGSGTGGGGGGTPGPSVLKDVAGPPVGVGISYDLFRNNGSYAALVKLQFDRVTAEYQMKHGANVKNDGSYDFTKTDEFVNLAQAGGLPVFGHVLAWHQNNNGTYLRSLTGTVGSNLVMNNGFENSFTNWTTQVSSSPPTSGAITIETTDVQSGTKAAKVLVTTPGPNAYSIQVYADNFTVAPGSGYKLTYWAKAASAGQSLRAVVQGSTYYVQQDQVLTTTWTQYTFPVSPSENAISVKFHFPAAGSFLIDNVSIALSSSNIDPVQVNNALQNWINTMVARYKTKVGGWDVANEVVIDGTGDLRTSANSPGSGGDYFYWADHLGRNYIADAFRWANAADPAARLFINDYNLESDSRKLDSVIKMINELKAASVPIHGVGLQMHISINTPNAGIDNAMQKLAATGLLVHVSEMDVRINPSNASPFTATPALLDAQAQKFRYVAESYFRYVPAAQRWGITVWNLTDADSWIVTGGKIDFPTLFDAGYNKKIAFTQFILGLQ